MSYRDLQPLPPDIAALLAAERHAPRPSPEREAAILARIETAVGAAAAVTTAAALGATADASARVARIGGGGAVAKGVAAAFPVSKALLATVALVAGGVGATGYLTLRPRASHPALMGAPARNVGSIDPASLSPPRQAGQTAPAPTMAPAPRVVPDAVPASTTWDRVARAAEADLAAESALLEHARRALDRGAPAAALVDVNQHARVFANGHLIEEREVLGIKALAASGRGDAARARAASFYRYFPHSIQRDAVDRAIRELR
jgi:hypothetical protein